MEVKMGKLRSYYDADLSETGGQPTRVKTEQNQNEVYCGVCGETFYIDDAQFEQTNKVIEEALENPFLCKDCHLDYEETQYQD